MEDIIDIIVTETTNLIEITSQSTDEVIDVNIIDNREDITLNVTPTVVEININSLTGNFGVAWGQITGTLSNQTDLNTALGLKADLVGGKVPSSQLPSYVDDVVEVANYAALPATGETGKIYITLDTNFIYRWSGSAYIEIKDSSAVWGAITGTLSSQSDLVTALNAKFDDPTGDTTQYIAGDGSLITFPVAGQSGTLVREVRNTTGATLTKGTIVYISGATGNKPTVSKAIATGDSTSAQTFGMCQANISNNSNGYIVCVGDITGLDTSALSEGVQLYLSSTTAGTYTTTKQLAPAHLVYIGVVTRSHPNQGQIEVKIQNGYELDEIHDVAISSVANNQGIFYESSTSLWKNKSIATVLGYTPEQPLTFNTPLSRSTNTVSIPAATSSANGYLTSTDWTTFNGKQAALSGTGFVKISGTTISYDNSTYALDSSVVHNTGAETISGIKYFFSGSKHDLLFVSETVGYASIAGYSHFKANTNHVEFINSTNTKATKFIHGNAAYEFTMPNASGTIALTSNLSSYLPLSGGTLTGALSGTSATFSANASATYFTATAGQGYNGNLNFNYNNANTSSFGYWGGGTNTVFLVTSAGAATFSSSVTAGSNLSGTNTIFKTNDASGYGIGIGYVSGSYGYITTQSGSSPLALSIDGSPKLWVASSGNVGIGTTSPSNKLSVQGSSLANMISWTDAINNTGYLGIRSSAASIGADNNLVFETAATERMRITSGGNVLIGTTTDVGAKLLVSGNMRVGTSAGNFAELNAVGSTPYLFLNGPASSSTIGASSHVNIFDSPNARGWVIQSNASQNLCLWHYSGSWSNVGNFNNSNGIYTPLSDKNKKKDFEVSNIGLNEVMQLKPTLYRMKSDESEGQKELGFIAQDVKSVIPNAYVESGDFIGLNFNPIVAALTKAVQEQQVQIQELKSLLNKQ